MFDMGKAHELINSIQGYIGGEPAVLFLTDNFAYFKARNGGDFARISDMLELKTELYLSNTKKVATDNIFTLYR